MNYHECTTKQVLEEYPHIDGGWTWAKYAAKPYIGCELACNYCYEWKWLKSKDSEEKKPEPVKILINAPQVLTKELKDKEKDIVDIGSWQPAEKKYRLSRELLKVCASNQFPVFVQEKSEFVLQDLDVIAHIQKETAATVAFSMVTSSLFSGFRQIGFFEGNTMNVEKRLRAMEIFASKGITTGTMLLPIIPFIFDNEENIEAVCRATRNAGGSFIVASFLTLEHEQKDRFYNILRKNFPDVLDNYIHLYGDKISPKISYMEETYSMVNGYASKYGLATHMPRYITPDSFESNKRVSEYLYNRSVSRAYKKRGRQLAMGYRKAAQTVDALSYDICDVFDTMGTKGLLKIPGINAKIAEKIQKILVSIEKQQ
ncbi:hypothetical protein KKH43_04700 [Patescibacteria group bacterium]|nr:hypothetical protein [Patescibacteria group bacterium]